MTVINQIFKFLMMIPVFIFIGCGILISLDIIQPSMFNNISKYYLLFSSTVFIGAAPVMLIVSAIKILIDFYNKGFKSGLILSIIIAFIFMASESLYSYVSLKTIYENQDIPLIKIFGILALPFTFSLFYLIGIIFDSLKNNKQYILNSKNINDTIDDNNEAFNELKLQNNSLKKELGGLSEKLEIETLALKISPEYYETPTSYDKEKQLLIQKIIEKGLKLVIKN